MTIRQTRYFLYRISDKSWKWIDLIIHLELYLHNSTYLIHLGLRRVYIQNDRREGQNYSKVLQTESGRRGREIKLKRKGERKF